MLCDNVFRAQRHGMNAYRSAFSAASNTAFESVRSTSTHVGPSKAHGGCTASGVGASSGGGVRWAGQGQEWQ